MKVFPDVLIEASNWSWVKAEGTLNINDTKLEATAVYLISDEEMYLIANTGLLYS